MTHSHSHKLSRRTLLKGVGVTMALPWLESLAVWGTGTQAGTPATAITASGSSIFTRDMGTATSS